MEDLFPGWSSSARQSNGQRLPTTVDAGVCVRSSRRVAAAAAAATAVGAHVPSSSSGLELDLRAPRRPVRATAPSSPLGGASSAAMSCCHGVGAGPGEVREHERLERHCPAPRPPRPAAAPSSFLRRGPRQRRRPARRPAAAAAPSPAGFSLPCWPPAARQQKKRWHVGPTDMWQPRQQNHNQNHQDGQI